MEIPKKLEEINKRSIIATVIYASQTFPNIKSFATVHHLAWSVYPVFVLEILHSFNSDV